jgi:hypothetical protein
METTIKITKSISIDENAILKIYYEHPKVILTFELVNELNEKTEPNKNFYYSYEGTLESLLKSNKILQSVNVEWFITGLENINYLNVKENIAIFSFPLQVNFINYVITVSCVKMVEEKYLQRDKKELYNLKLDINKLISKNSLLESKCDYLELKINEMNKNTHLEKFILFDDEPIYFNRQGNENVNIKSITLINKCNKSYSHKIVFPQSLLFLKIVGGDYDFNFEFPPNLISLHISNLKKFDFLLNLPDSLEDLNLKRLNKFNQIITFPKCLKSITLKKLNNFNQNLDIPETVEDITIDKLNNYSSSSVLRIPKSVINLEISKLVNSKIECYSTDENIKRLLENSKSNKITVIEDEYEIIKEEDEYEIIDEEEYLISSEITEEQFRKYEMFYKNKTSIYLNLTLNQIKTIKLNYIFLSSKYSVHAYNFEERYKISIGGV